MSSKRASKQHHLLHIRRHVVYQTHSPHARRYTPL